MFGIGMPELLVILLICLVVFGAKRLPEIGGGLGKGIKNFKNSLSDTQRELTSDNLKVVEKANSPGVNN